MSFRLSQQDIAKGGLGMVEARDHYGRSLMHTSAAEGNVAIVQKIIAMFGPSMVWQEDSYKATPLHLAARRASNVEVVKCLLAHGGSRLGMARDQCGNTAVSG